MTKYIDYEFTPKVFHPLVDSDGKDKSFRAPAQKIFIADTGEKRAVVPGGPEDEMLMEEVRKNNPEAHGVAPTPVPPVAVAPVAPAPVVAAPAPIVDEVPVMQAKTVSGAPIPPAEVLAPTPVPPVGGVMEA